MFKVGQEILCVDDSPGRASGKKDLAKHKTYIIRDFDLDGDVRLHGIAGTWFLSRFRPLDEVLSKISISELLEEPVQC